MLLKMNSNRTQKNAHSSYEDLEWKIKARQIKLRDDLQCQICGKKRNLVVHHVLYIYGRKLWDYSGEYFITLCEFHHGKEHACLELINKKKYKQHLLSGLLAQDIVTIKN